MSGETALFATVTTATARHIGWSPIVELRQYTLRPGKRDVVVDLFESSSSSRKSRPG